MSVNIKGKCLWIVQVCCPIKRPRWNDASVIDDVWENQGIGVMAETLEGAIKTVREEKQNCKMISVNKHTNQIYVERELLDAK